MVSIRPWTILDADFVVKVRNTPELQKWFGQSKDITYTDQVRFMVSEYGSDYNGHIIESDGVPVGICNLREGSGEFGIAVLPEHQNKGIATKALRSLLIKYSEKPLIWSYVFEDNPVLSWYSSSFDFKQTERVKNYCLKGEKYVNAVKIELRRCA